MDILRTDDGKQTMGNYGNDATTNMSLTEIIEEESHEVTTVVIFVISAVLVIILIFVMAVFIDCRQQKLEGTRIKRFSKGAKRKIQKALPTLPTIGETSSHRDDERRIVENMEVEPTSSQSYVV